MTIDYFHASDNRAGRSKTDLFIRKFPFDFVICEVWRVTLTLIVV